MFLQYDYQYVACYFKLWFPLQTYFSNFIFWEQFTHKTLHATQLSWNNVKHYNPPLSRSMTKSCFYIGLVKIWIILSASCVTILSLSMRPLLRVLIRQLTTRQPRKQTAVRWPTPARGMNIWHSFVPSPSLRATEANYCSSRVTFSMQMSRAALVCVCGR